LRFLTFTGGPANVWGFGLVLALSIAGLGIWFARRRSALA
jgi:hypothetical protein